MFELNDNTSNTRAEAIVRDLSLKVNLMAERSDAGYINMQDVLNMACSIDGQLAELGTIVGINSEVYINLSTHIARVLLQATIACVNKANNNLMNAYPGKSTEMARYAFRDVLRLAWHCICFIDEMYVTTEFRDERYTQQRYNLENMAVRMNVDTYKPKYYLYGFNTELSEDEYFSKCCTVDDYKNYMRRHPNGRYATKAKAMIQENMMQQQRQTEKKTKRSIWIWAIIFVAFMALMGLCCISYGLTPLCYGCIICGVGIAIFAIANGTKFTTVFGKKKGHIYTLATWGIALLMVVSSFVLININGDMQDKKELEEILAGDEMYRLTSFIEDKSKDEKYRMQAYDAYLKKAKERMDEISLYNSVDTYGDSHILSELDRLLDFAPLEASKLSEGRTLLNSTAERLYQEASEINTLRAWRRFENLVTWRSDEAEQKINALLEVVWDSEPSAWDYVQYNDDKATYIEYLRKYPEGEHRLEAEACVVNKTDKSAIHVMPQLEKLNKVKGETSTITIENTSDQELTVVFDGPDKRLMFIEPHKKATITLASGEYKIYGKTLEADGKLIQTFDGGKYYQNYVITDPFSANTIEYYMY